MTSSWSSSTTQLGNTSRAGATRRVSGREKESRLKAFGAFLFGVVAGVVAVILAGRSPRGREVIARTNQTLESFIDGVAEGFGAPRSQ